MSQRLTENACYPRELSNRQASLNTSTDGFSKIAIRVLPEWKLFLPLKIVHRLPIECLLPEPVRRRPTVSLSCYLKAPTTPNYLCFGLRWFLTIGCKVRYNREELIFAIGQEKPGSYSARRTIRKRENNSNLQFLKGSLVFPHLYTLKL